MATRRDSDWARLAAFVVSRRVELGLKDRRAMARASEAIGSSITDRTLGTLERGGSVSASTLAAVDNVLGWEPGSAKSILDGGQPALKGESLQAAPKPPAYSDPAEQRLWERIADVVITGDPVEDERIKRGMIRQVRLERLERQERENERRRAV
jgi:hypothetical protein